MSDNRTFAGDMFCEQRFWSKYNISVAAADPVCMSTGVCMVLMPLIPNVIVSKQRCRFHEHIPIQFQLCKSTLALVGVGTIIFHYFTDQRARDWHLNHHMYDWMPITMMGNAIIILYCSAIFDLSEMGWTLAFLVACLWSYGLAMFMDTDTENYYSSVLGQAGEQNMYGTILNLVLLAPMTITLVSTYFCGLFKQTYTWPLWTSILIVLGLWLPSSYACVEMPELSMLHALYHVVISYAFIYAACLGVSMDADNWRLTLVYIIWPELEHVDTTKNGADMHYCEKQSRMRVFDVKIDVPLVF